MPGDDILIRRSAEGDERAFAELVRDKARPAAALIRRMVPDAAHAEDVFQETLLAAWVGIRRLRDPASFRAWLIKLARNRCRDFYRSKERRDMPVEERELQGYVNRFGRAVARRRTDAADAVESLADLPESDREIARQFYLQGLTIKEIAVRRRCAVGTVKRRLHQARVQMRASLGAGGKDEEARRE